MTNAHPSSVVRHSESSRAGYRTPTADEKYVILMGASPEVAEYAWRCRSPLPSLDRVSLRKPSCRRRVRTSEWQQGGVEYAEQIDRSYADNFHRCLCNCR